MTLIRNVNVMRIAVLAMLTIVVFFLGNQRLAQALEPDPHDIFCVIDGIFEGVGDPVHPIFGTACPSGEIPTQCSDGIDNDSDGLVDLNDPDCANVSDNDESGPVIPIQCIDGIDNDGDGLIDLVDPGCSGPADDDESDDPTPPAQCADGLDNDDDGLTDLADPGCANASDNDETNPTPIAQCADGVDNDDDGLIDMSDPGCSSSTDNNETNTTSPAQCADGADNDGDGLIDLSDPGCANASDNDETNLPPGVENTLALCSDTIDNNGNGLIDLADSSCTAYVPKLTVKKMVVNTGGGTATSSNFTMNITGNSVSLASFAGSASGTQTTLYPGAFSVSESGGPIGYLMATSSGCVGIMGIGSSTTCTITNTFSTSTTDMIITKGVDKTSPNPGDAVTYTLTVTNSGPNTAPSVVVADLLPSGLTFMSSDASTTATTYASTTGTWAIGTLANGSSTVLHIVASVNTGTGGQTITNTATVHSNLTDPNTGNDSASSAITPIAPAAPATTGGGGGGGGGGSGLVLGVYGVGGSGVVLGAATSTPTISCDAYLTEFIKFGANNNPEQVRRLQIVLRDYEHLNVEVSGVFDQKTLTAVHVFQTRYTTAILTPWGIKNSTGYVYLTTRKKVNEIYCNFGIKFPLTQIEQRIVTEGAQKPTVATVSSVKKTVPKAPVQEITSPATVPSVTTETVAPESTVEESTTESKKGWDPWGDFLRWLGF